MMRVWIGGFDMRAIEQNGSAKRKQSAIKGIEDYTYNKIDFVYQRIQATCVVSQALVASKEARSAPLLSGVLSLERRVLYIHHD